MSYTRSSSKNLSEKSTKLEEQIKTMYGQKRGRAFIAAAKQKVDYYLGSDNEKALTWIRDYETELEKCV